MASEQAKRENVRDERKIEVEKDRVPKMATHFESLADKQQQQQIEAVPVRVAGIAISGTAESGGAKKKGSQMQQQPSLEEISRLRGAAQQNSADAIRAAEDSYEKGKTGGHAAEMGRQAKDTAAEKGRQGKNTAAEKAAEARYVVSSRGRALKDTVVEKGQQAKDYTALKAAETKDVIATKGQSASQYAAEKAKAAKDTTVDTSMTVAQYAAEKAKAAKDVTVESGKGAAAGVKDQAVVAGWEAARFTLEKTAEATKAMADVTSKVAGYTGDVAVAAKDKVAGAGQAVAGFAGEKLAAVKDTVVATEESAAQYAARKKEEARRDQEMKRSSPPTKEGGETFSAEEYHGGQAPSEKIKESWGGGAYESLGGGEGEYRQESKEGAVGVGIMRAIGETLVEIGQTTKDLVSGQHPLGVLRGKDEKEEPFSGAGKDL